MLFFKKKPDKDAGGIDPANLPRHIAIIMDGNGRWAKKRGLTRNFGHREGSRTLKKIAGHCDDIGIEYLTVYAFSTENWKRPKSEVETLMGLLLEYLKNADREMEGRSIRIRVIGDKQGLPEEIRQESIRLEQRTKNNTGLKLNIALNYGGRDELVHAVKEIAKEVLEKRVAADKLDFETVAGHLYTTGIPDPDLLIRTSGEKRISNFLLWQLAYTEFWFTDTLWPDFKKKDLLEAIRIYQKRNRRFGGV